LTFNGLFQSSCGERVVKAWHKRFGWRFGCR